MKYCVPLSLLNNILVTQYVLLTFNHPSPLPRRRRYLHSSVRPKLERHIMRNTNSVNASTCIDACNGDVACITS